MPISRHHIIEEFLLSYRTTGQLLLRLLQTAFESDTQVHFGELLVLKVLKAHGPLSQRVIASHLCHSEAAISRQVSLAEENGYVMATEDPSNRRSLIITLTAKGEAVVNDLNEKVVNYLGEVLVDLSDEELRTALTVNSRIQTILIEQHHKEAHGKKT